MYPSLSCNIWMLAQQPSCDVPRAAGSDSFPRNGNQQVPFPLSVSRKSPCKRKPGPMRTPWVCLFCQCNTVKALLNELTSSCWYSSDLGSSLISLKLWCLIAFVCLANSQLCKLSQSENIFRVGIYNGQGSQECRDLVKDTSLFLNMQGNTESCFLKPVKPCGYKNPLDT